LRCRSCPDRRWPARAQFLILSHVDPGFRTANVVQAGRRTRRSATGGAAASRTTRRQSRRSAHCRVTVVGAVNRLPLGAGANNVVYIDIEGQPMPPAGSAPMVDRRVATPRYFDVMGFRWSAAAGSRQRTARMRRS
jgi:hypothetical protein